MIPFFQPLPIFKKRSVIFRKLKKHLRIFYIFLCITFLENCNQNEDCLNEGKCEDKFCSCNDGLTGDKCEIVTDCFVGKYKDCEKSGGKCKYEGSKAVCECFDNKILNDKENICQSKY